MREEYNDHFCSMREALSSVILGQPLIPKKQDGFIASFDEKNGMFHKYNGKIRKSFAYSDDIYFRF